MPNSIFSSYLMYFLSIQYIFYFIHVRNIDKYLYQNESSPRNHDKFELSQRESFLVLTKKKLHFCWWFWSRKSSQVEHLAYQKNLCLTTHLNVQVPWTEFGLVLQTCKTSEQHLDCTNFLRTGPDFNDDCKFSFHFKISVKSTAATKGIQLYRSSILFYICGLST